ncbi:MAG TPA: hypothetical protein DCZ94_16325 [Lentisphaeria bacterium]|nr:hypothetical protein [Lentisphaeria bacterium]
MQDAGLKFLSSVVRRLSSAFTLIELLLVIAVIAVLIALLLPALKNAKDTAKSVVCKNNMRQLGIMINTYSQDFDGSGPVRMYYIPIPGSGNVWDPSWPYTTWYYLYPNSRPPMKNKYSLYYDTVYNCPAEAAGIRFHSNYGRIYSYNAWLRDEDGIQLRQRLNAAPFLRGLERPSETLLVLETAHKGGSENCFYWSTYTEDGLAHPDTMLINHHLRGSNIVFTDGHAAGLKDNEWPRDPATGNYVSERYNGGVFWNGK